MNNFIKILINNYLVGMKIIICNFWILFVSHTEFNWHFTWLLWRISQRNHNGFVWFWPVYWASQAVGSSSTVLLDKTTWSCSCQFKVHHISIDWRKIVSEFQLEYLLDQNNLPIIFVVIFDEFFWKSLVWIKVIMKR